METNMLAARSTVVRRHVEVFWYILDPALAGFRVSMACESH